MYVVTVYATPMSVPFNFTVHTWVEVSDGATTNRYDLWGYPGLTTIPLHGYIYKNLFPDHRGTTLSPFATSNELHLRQIGTVVATVTGDVGSAAHQLAVTIENEVSKYPYAHQYNMILGPNSIRLLRGCLHSYHKLN